MLLTVGCAVVQVDPSQNGERANKPVRADTSPTLGLGVCFFGGFFGFVGFLSRQPKKNRKKKGALRCAFFEFFFFGSGCVQVWAFAMCEFVCESFWRYFFLKRNRAWQCWIFLLFEFLLAVFYVFVDCARVRL